MTCARSIQVSAASIPSQPKVNLSQPQIFPTNSRATTHLPSTGTKVSLSQCKLSPSQPKHNPCPVKSGASQAPLEQVSHKSAPIQFKLEPHQPKPVPSQPQVHPKSARVNPCHHSSPSHRNFIINVHIAKGYIQPPISQSHRDAILCKFTQSQGM